MVALVGDTGVGYFLHPGTEPGLAPPSDGDLQETARQKSPWKPSPTPNND